MIAFGKKTLTINYIHNAIANEGVNNPISSYLILCMTTFVVKYMSLNKSGGGIGMTKMNLRIALALVRVS
jgi:hypothetical protein